MTDSVSGRPPAVVLLSGGLDSATVLAIARERGFEPCALSFRYGQRHVHELTAADVRGRPVLLFSRTCRRAIRSS